jgi:hypothetical protein
LKATPAHVVLALAADFFAQQEANEKKQMEEAKPKYGADAVAVLARHVKELYDLQMDALHSTLRGGAPPKTKP